MREVDIIVSSKCRYGNRRQMHRGGSRLREPIKAQPLSEAVLNEYVIAMNAVETRLEIAQRHVRNGEKLVLRQREIIAEIALRMQSTDLAEALLINFESALDAHNDQLNRLS